jgi:vacuolar-type H+-ATPase subunit E/Vma4
MKKKYEKEIEKQRQDYEKKLENQRTELEKQKQEYKTEIESSRNMIINEKNEYIAKLEARLDKFESTVVNLAAEPKTTTKTTNNVVVNNHTLNLSQEHVSKVLDEHFTKEVAAGGQKGLAKMVHEKMLTGPDGKPTYVCVDSSRHTFEFTNNDGDVERDVKAKKLTKALINSKIQQKAAEVGNQIWTKEDGHVDSTLYEYCSPKVMELACFEKDDSKFRSELSALTS